MAVIRFRGVPELSAYGKLPLSQEFLRTRCFRGASGRFRQWVDEGAQIAAQRAGTDRYQLGAPYHMLFFPEGDKQAVVARLEDSTDAGGLRAFPMTLSTSVPVKELCGPPSELVGRLWPIWKNLEQCSDTVRTLADAGTFQETTNAWRPPGPTSASEEPEGTSSFLAHLVDNCQGESEPLDRFARTLWELRQACGWLSSRRLPESRAPALRLPLTSQIEPAAQVWTWLRLLETSGFLSGRSAPVTLAFPASGDAPMWLFVRPPRSEDFWVLGSRPQGVLSPELDVSESSGEAAWQAFRQRVLARFGRDDARLRDLAGFALE